MNARLVGLVSCYLEGRLVQGAVRSLLDACEAVYVFEGPCGAPILGEVPATDLGPLAADERVTVQHGRWRTDARKRSDVVRRVKQAYAEEPEPLWGLWLDGDEVLFNGEYVLDWLNVLHWQEQLHPDQEPYLGKPLRMVELDGSLVWTRGRLLRLDLIRNFEVSTATYVNRYGITQGAGNFPDLYSKWRLPLQPHFDADRIVVRPPIPGEPHVLHRSALRHPLRSGNRMHEQEAHELEKRKQPA